MSTVTGSDQYKEDLAAIAATGSGPEFVVGTQTSYTAAWTGNVGFAALHDGQQITYWLPVSIRKQRNARPDACRRQYYRGDSMLL